MFIHQSFSWVRGQIRDSSLLRAIKRSWIPEGFRKETQIVIQEMGIKPKDRAHSHDLLILVLISHDSDSHRDCSRKFPVARLINGANAIFTSSGCFHDILRASDAKFKNTLIVQSSSKHIALGATAHLHARTSTCSPPLIYRGTHYRYNFVSKAFMQKLICLWKL